MTDVKDNKIIIDRTLRQLKLNACVKRCRREGPFLICDLSLETGGKVNRIENRSMEIALALRSQTEPLIYPVPSEGVVRMEFLMEELKSVNFDKLIADSEFAAPHRTLPMALGKTRQGQTLVADLATMPHLLVAGSTGAGKSVALHAMIASLASSGKDIRLVLVDPKKVEFSCYSKTKMLFYPIAQDAKTSLDQLDSLVDEMERRFLVLQKAKCRDRSSYSGHMPYIVLVIDELAELMMVAGRRAQTSICRLAQKSRACGIHVIAATQRPSTDVVTGLIKANFPARMSCRVSSITDSRVVLDRAGAERLGGKGDAILACTEHPFVRFKGAYIESDKLATYVKKHQSWWRGLWK